jgi:L-lactate dehydrogenase complex protein LldF
LIGGLDRAARRVLPDEDAVARHDDAIFHLRGARDSAAAEIEDFEALREHAARIKAHSLASLAEQLTRFEAAAIASGAVVHWAEDAAEHNEIVHGLLEARGVTRVVKSKSMLTEECDLNPHLEAKGIEVVDTDLGERIVQLAGEPPSHIVMPAIHKTKGQIGALFHDQMGMEAGVDDAQRLVEHARDDLRARFLAAQAGITGVNFAVADTGSVVVCTNEGNADLGTSLPPIHIACMGLEKVVPGHADVGVLLRLLARSATGQPINVYTSTFTGPRPGAELHIVIVDNGRGRLLADPRHHSLLGCIRCGACLNTCPVYRRSGGHAYGLTVPGPIGIALAPALQSGDAAQALPFASTLCGSCSAVCPVRIDLHDQLLAWRLERKVLSAPARLGAWLAARVLMHPALYRATGRVARLLWPALGRRFAGNPAGAWLHGRELPPHPGERFADRYRREQPTCEAKRP